MRTVNVHEAKTTLSSLLAAIEEHDEVVVICRAGKPIAELRKVRPRAALLTPHPTMSRLVFHEDPMAPLSPEDWGDLA